MPDIVCHTSNAFARFAVRMLALHAYCSKISVVIDPNASNSGECYRDCRLEILMQVQLLYLQSLLALKLSTSKKIYRFVIKRV